MISPTPSTRPRVFVTDFDGTITGNDFYQLFLERHYPPDGPDYWSMVLAGQISHFDCLKHFYGTVAPGEAALRQIVADLEPPHEFAARVTDLRAAGWEIVVASAGCRWYIDLLLARHGVELPLHANNGGIVDGRLVMEPNPQSPFMHPTLGIDKAAVVRSFQVQGYEVAYAGDGMTDLAAALLVAPEMRFGKHDLAKKLRERNEPFREFHRWHEIAIELARYHANCE